MERSRWIQGVCLVIGDQLQLGKDGSPAVWLADANDTNTRNKKLICKGLGFSVPKKQQID